MLQSLESTCKDLEKETLSLAKQLSKSRQAVLPQLEKEMCKRLQQLGMPEGQFKIQLRQSEQPYNKGIDLAEFLFSANKGVAVADVSKVASGGEMSRLMLAIKSIITDSVLLPTVIFDEIDTGISGETANRVAQVMDILANDHQVIAITHLPQIAAMGRQHYLVYKETKNEQTTTNLRALSEEDRIQVIATMLSGAHVTESALSTARELIQTTNKA